jgi:hypothetical protein
MVLSIHIARIVAYALRAGWYDAFLLIWRDP